MSRVFMVFAASGENLFEARCGAKDFFDSLGTAGISRSAFFCYGFLKTFKLAVDNSRAS